MSKCCVIIEDYITSDPKIVKNAKSRLDKISICPECESKIKSACCKYMDIFIQNIVKKPGASETALKYLNVMYICTQCSDNLNNNLNIKFYANK